jgi:hypothetical protein
MARRIWFSQAGRLLVAYLLLDVVIMIYSSTAGARLNAGQDVLGEQAGWTAADVLLCWLAWRAGKLALTAWVVLLFGVVVPLLQLLIGMATFTLYIGGFFVILILQAAALLTPPVRHHVSRGHQSA